MQSFMKGAITLAVVAGASVGASASIKNPAAFQPQSLGSGISLRGPGGYSTGFEASEGFVQGPIGGQNGWLTNAASSPPRGTMDVRDGVSAGNGSPNALKLSKGPQGLGAFGIAQAPNTLNANGLTVDTKMNDNGGANAGILGFNGAGISFRIEFDYLGNILVVDYVGTTGTVVDTGVPWVFGQWNQIGVSITGTGVVYSYGGTPIHTSPLNTGGASFDTIQFYHDNYEGTGATPVGTAAIYFDNLRVVPAPGAVALLGLGGLVAGRRRRA